MGQSGDQIPVGGEIFHTSPVWPYGPTSPYTNGTWSVPVVKRMGHGVDRPSPFSTEVKQGAELINLSCLRDFVACLG